VLQPPPKAAPPALGSAPEQGQRPPLVRGTFEGREPLFFTRTSSCCRREPRTLSWEGTRCFPHPPPEGWEPSPPEGCSTAFLFVPNSRTAAWFLLANAASHLHCLEQREHRWFLPQMLCFGPLWMLGRMWVYFAFSCLGLIKSIPLCSRSGCSSLQGCAAPVNPRGSGQTPLCWGPRPWVGVGLQPPAQLPIPAVPT